MVSLAFLGLASLVIVLERWHTYSEPLERDITTYAVIGAELLKGRVLYSDLWDHKPPAIHLTYALAEAAAGEGPMAVFLLNVLAALATLAGLYQAGKALGGRAGGLWAAAIWAVVSGDLYLQANQPNEEVFLNALQTWIFALWLSASAKTMEPHRWVLIGILTAIASLYKPFAVLEIFFLAAAYLYLNPGPSPRKMIVRQMGILLSLVALVWACLFGWFSVQGRFLDFLEAVFIYNFYYSVFQNGTFLNFFKGMAGLDLNHSTLLALGLLLTLGCLGASLARRKKEGRGFWLYGGAFALAAELEVASTGHFFIHYYQLLMPPLIIGAAWGLGELGGLIEKGNGWKCLPGALLLAFLIFQELPFYRLGPQEWANRKYSDGPLFGEAYELGRELDGMLLPGETFWEWGNETELYFAARRSPPSGVFYSYPLLESILFEKLSYRVLEDLEKARPEVIVVNMSYYVSAEQRKRDSILRWAWNLYRPLPQNPYREPFLLLMRKGGNLEKRLLAQKP